MHVTEVGDFSFSNCQNLNSLEFRATKMEEDEIENDELTSGIIGVEAFSYTSIKKIVIPKMISHIGDRAFSNCTKLTTVIIIDQINPPTIGNDAFENTKITKFA